MERAPHVLVADDQPDVLTLILNQPLGQRAADSLAPGPLTTCLRAYVRPLAPRNLSDARSRSSIGMSGPVAH